MNSGIVYYNRGVKCLIRLWVSMSSLREVFQGDIAVLHEGGLPDWFVRESKRTSVRLVAIPADQSVAFPLCQKPRLYRWTPFDVSLFIDADTLVLKDPSSLLDAVREHGFVATRFSNWVTTGRRMRNRICSWQKVVDPKWIETAMNWGPAINTGVFGWKRGHPMMPVWADLTMRGYANGGPVKRMVDETACQVLSPRYKVHVAGEEWNRSVTYGLSDNPGIVHFHGGKHLRIPGPWCEQWRTQYWRHRNRSPEYDSLGDAQGDRHLAKLELAKQRSDLTVCMAADERYSPKLYRHFEQWMRTPGLREQRYLLLMVNSQGQQPPEAGVFRPFTQWHNVKLVAYRQDGVSQREAAFSAFIYGVARHVTTPYHMKLDGDASPRGAFVWPEYHKHAAMADPWHYTRVKGDPAATRHWLNTLDQWYGGKPLYPPNLGANIRFRHRRIRSYCCIARTDLVQRIVEKCPLRLPVPSHDTTLFYLCQRWGLDVQRHPFRQCISA